MYRFKNKFPAFFQRLRAQARLLRPGSSNSLLVAQQSISLRLFRREVTSVAELIVLLEALGRLREQFGGAFSFN